MPATTHISPAAPLRGGWTRPLLRLAPYTALALVATALSASAQTVGKKPNILVIWGDDIGIPQISAYTMGLMGYKTPNIDRIAKEGALFTDAYGQQSCTAGRASFILGQEPFRTGLLTIGMPGDPHGITDWMPTIADAMKQQGYVTGQFGKKHLGDQDHHLPTKHCFDEFFGNLYHLNAEEEPEGYLYPKDPEFRKRFGPRGVIKSTADGKIEDTGPLNTGRMPTVDEEFLAAGKDFIQRQAKAQKPFLCWFNATRMHVFTHLKKESLGKTGKGIHADGMVEHDGHVGQLLDLLDELKIADNTIVIYSTDNGAEIALWPDGAMTMFHGEKGTTWESGFRIPMMIRWPGVIKPGTVYNDVISNLDWFPTLLAAAGAPDVKEQLSKGANLNGKQFKVHLDGYNFLPYFQGKEEKGPRERIFYFDQGGQSHCRPLERLESEFRGSERRQHRHGDARSDVMGDDHQSADGPLRAWSKGRRRSHEVFRPADLAAGADPATDQGILLRLRSVSLPDRLYTQPERDWLWNAAEGAAMDRLKKLEAIKPR